MNMSEKQLLLEYKNEINNLVKSAKELNLSDFKIDEIFQKCFHTLRESNGETREIKKSGFCTFITKILKIFSLLFILAIFIYIILNVHQPTYSFVLRNVQGFIYPGLKFIRFVSVPIIERFPSLTDLYDESCLIENPYFYVNEMECWPCENVFTIIEMKANQSTHQSEIPYIIKTSHPPVPYNKLKTMYKQNKAILHKESSSIKSTSFKLNHLKDIFDQNMEDLNLTDIHISWRINKMVSARIVRSLFPRPQNVSPRAGISVERFIMIDGAKAPPYALPNTECSFISLRQASGQRTIVLKPSPECSRHCRTVSIVLQPSTILWYNWWYWRPVSLPLENTTKTTISYVSSYC